MYQTGNGSRESFNAAEKVYYDFKEKLINEAVAGGDPFYKVGPVLWLQKWQKRIDINSADREQLIDFGLSAQLADKFLTARARNGFFSGNAAEIIEKYGQ